MVFLGVITHLLTIDPNFLGHPSRTFHQKSHPTFPYPQTWQQHKQPGTRERTAHHGGCFVSSWLRAVCSMCCLVKYPHTQKLNNKYWLVVSTHLKNISQIGNLPQVGMKIKKMKPPPRISTPPKIKMTPLETVVGRRPSF